MDSTSEHSWIFGLKKAHAINSLIKLFDKHRLVDFRLKEVSDRWHKIRKAGALIKRSFSIRMTTEIDSAAGRQHILMGNDDNSSCMYCNNMTIIRIMK